MKNAGVSRSLGEPDLTDENAQDGFERLAFPEFNIQLYANVTDEVRQSEPRKVKRCRQIAWP